MAHNLVREAVPNNKEPEAFHNNVGNFGPPFLYPWCGHLGACSESEKHLSRLRLGEEMQRY